MAPRQHPCPIAFYAEPPNDWRQPCLIEWLTSSGCVRVHVAWLAHEVGRAQAHVFASSATG